MKWQRWQVIAAAAALVAVGIFTCRGSGPAASALDAGVAAEPPARTPDDLIADIYVTSPNSSWTRLQRGVGGAVGILPATLPGVLVAMTDLDVQLASELDGTAPMYGVVAGDPADPGVTFAMKLVDSRRARGLLVEGDTARFTGKDAAGMTLLVPNRSGERRFEIAITQNGYLVVTRRAADLARLGHYVTRTLPQRPLPAKSAAFIEIPRAALQTVLKPRLEAFWKDSKSFLLTQDERMRAERGRAPDFGDPAAIVSVLDAILGRRVAILGDLEKVQVSFDVTDDAALLDATLVPSNEGGPARQWVQGMKVGDASSVLAMSSSSALALSTRDSEADRSEQAKALENAITTSLGARLKDPAKLHEVVEAMTKARDESVALALGLDEPTGVLVRAPLRDAALADKAIRGVFDLAKAEPFKELLRVREVTASNDDLPGLGRISALTLVRESKESKDPKDKRDAGASKRTSEPSAAKPPAGAAWLVDEKVLSLGLGGEPLVTLKTGAKPDRKLADEPSLKRFIAAVGSDATTVIVGQPLRLDPKRANLPTAPLGITVGKKGTDAHVHVDVSDSLLREVARWQMGF